MLFRSDSSRRGDGRASLARVGRAGHGVAPMLFNTALESLIDHLHPEMHPAIKIAKDCAAGAVLLLSGGAVIVGIIVVLVALGVLS